MLGLKYPPVVLLNKYKHKDDFVIHATDSEKEKKYKKYFGDLIASLFQDIGNGVNTRYGCDVSNADMPVVAAFLAAKGFSVSFAGSHSTSNINRLGSAFLLHFLAGRILMAQSCDINTNNKGCHYWVIDGLATKNGFYLINNNWGWDGKDNGYYASEVFEPPTSEFSYGDITLISVSWL
jgi:hypothetical protein